MDDTISRQAVLDAMSERPLVRDEWADEYELGQRNQYDADKLAVETVPFAEPHWISVRERLPQKGTKAILLYSNGKISGGSYLGEKHGILIMQT